MQSNETTNLINKRCSVNLTLRYYSNVNVQDSRYVTHKELHVPDVRLLLLLLKFAADYTQSRRVAAFWSSAEPNYTVVEVDDHWRATRPCLILLFSHEYVFSDTGAYNSAKHQRRCPLV